MAKGDGFLMKEFGVESSTAWAEGTALLGSNRSADPGAKTEGRAMAFPARRDRPSLPYPVRDWHQSDKSRGAKPRVLEKENAGRRSPGSS